MKQTNLQSSFRKYLVCVLALAVFLTACASKVAKALEKVYLPTSIQQIGENAFYVWNVTDAAALSIYYGGTKEQWKALMKNVGDGNDRLKSAKVHYNATVEDLDKKTKWF